MKKLKGKKPIKQVELILLDGQGVNPREPLRRRMALRIDGEDVDVVSLNLDSEPSRKRQAKTWAKRFQLKEADILDKLRSAALDVTAEEQMNNVKRLAAKMQAAREKAAAPQVRPITLSQARPVFGKWLDDTDPDLLDVVLGTVMAHRLDGDPVWVFIIGAPGDGKTETIRALSHDPAIYMLSSLKPAALISGYLPDDGSDPSLLPKLDARVLVVKDFTTVLTMPNEARAEILGTLRDAYDGEASKAFGNGEVRKYTSRFGMLAAVTPVIEAYWGVSQQLGERFLRFSLKSAGRVAKVTRAMINTDAETTMRAELSEAAQRVLAQPTPAVTIPNHNQVRLIHLADFVSRARSEVSRDRKGAVAYIPKPEIGTRVGKTLKKLAIGIALARGIDVVDDDIFRIIRRVGVDCLPSVRARLLRVLWSLRERFEPTSEVANAAEVSTDTARVWLEDLRLLEIVDREATSSNLHTWRLRGAFIETMGLAGLAGEEPTPPLDSYPHDGVDAEHGGKCHPHPDQQGELNICAEGMGIEGQPLEGEKQQ